MSKTRTFAVIVDQKPAQELDASSSSDAAHAVYKGHKFGRISVETHFGDGGHRIETDDGHTIVVMPAQGGGAS